LIVSNDHNLIGISFVLVLVSDTVNYCRTICAYSPVAAKPVT
jgi:hypothetical protein